MTRDTAPEPVLVRVAGLSKTFGNTRRHRRTGAAVHALRDVSFDIRCGETLGLVGESGSGKSTAAACLLRLTPADGGLVEFDGVDILSLRGGRLRELRRRMQIVFQDPFGSLDPRLSVLQLVEEPLLVYGEKDASKRRRRALEMLERVGLSAAQASRNPHAFSGGQRQRIAIARALVLNPDLLVLDEPVTALDVSVQAQVLNLLKQLQRELKLTYLFIVHDLAVAQHMCHRIAVMYLGQIVETATTDELFDNPQHPYTIGLLAAAPIPDPDVMQRKNTVFVGSPAEKARAGLPTGCSLHPRCPVGRDRELCRTATPELHTTTAGHLVACHYPQEAAALRPQALTPSHST